MPNNMTDGNPRNWDEQSMDTGSMGAIQNAKKNVLTSFFTNDFGGYGRIATKNAIAGRDVKRIYQRNVQDKIANQVSQVKVDSVM